MKIVLGTGPKPSLCCFIGEAPGKQESIRGIPFIGPAGQELKRYLGMYNEDLNSYYRTNICKEFKEGNPDPTPQQILDWTPHLLSELNEVRPQLIVCIGRHAAQFFLGVDCPPLEIIHGIPHKSNRQDLPESIRNSIILPTYHTAAGLWNYEMRSFIKWDMEQVAATVSSIKSGRRIRIRYDEFERKEFYRDIDGKSLELILKLPFTIQDLRDFGAQYGFPNGIIGYDTEGRPGNEWSGQISLKPGEGFLLRKSQPDFDRGIRALAEFLHKHKPTLALHDASTPICACYDVVISRRFGLELQGIPWFNTMYNAYLYRLESQALKTLCFRWLDMKMEEYENIIGDIGKDKQIKYLSQVLELDLPKAPKRLEIENTGERKESQPQHILVSAENILRDIFSGKQTEEGPTDPLKRWKKLSKSNPFHVKMVTNILGPMPEGSLEDLPIEKATYYAARDSDATLRLALHFMETNPSYIKSLMSEGMKILPIVEAMQRNGMPVSRSYFQSLRDEMQEGMDRLNHRISNLYWDGKPFNPMSFVQVGSLLRRRGLKPGKKTLTGAASTAKLSIEQYRYTDDAISDVFDWREMQHNRDQYCNDVLERIPEDHEDDIYIIHSNLKSTTVTTRRFSSINPNILAIPVRTEMGIKIRQGYTAPEGKIFCGFDLSGIEVRCMAHVSQDPLLCKVFIDSIHPHQYTASRLFKVLYDQVTKTQKAVGKENNFLTIYGGGYKKLYEKLRQAGITDYGLDRCKEFMRDFFSTYQGVDEYKKRTVSECKKTEIVYDHWEMPRYLPGINCGDQEIESDEGRNAVSHRIQGMAQGMIRNSMAWLGPQIDCLIKSGDLDPECWRLQIHDELIFLVNEGEEEILEPLVMCALTKHAGIELIVPIEAEAHYGKTWAELK